MPGKLQGFKNLRTTWLRLEPDYDYFLATAYVEFFYTPERQFAQGPHLLNLFVTVLITDDVNLWTVLQYRL